MEFSRPRPSILSLFDPLCLTQEIDRIPSPGSDKENDLVDTSDFYPSGTHNHVPPRTLKRRLVDVGDTTVELLSNELERELSYMVNDDDDENDTLTFRDMAKAATPKWSPRHTTVLGTPSASFPCRTPLAEISLKHESTPLTRKKPYKHQAISTALRDSQSACLIFPPSISSDGSSCCPPLYAEVPEVRVNNEPVLQSSSVPANSSGDSSGSPSFRTLNQSSPIETLVSEPSIPILSSSLVPPTPPRIQARTGHLSPALPTDNISRYSVDLQTSFQIHFPSHDTTFDLLKDKISFPGNELDSFFNNLEDSSLDDDALILGSKIEGNSGISLAITLNQAQSVGKIGKQLSPVSKHVAVTESSKASLTNADAPTLVQPSISNQVDTMPSLVADTSTKATFVQPHASFTSPLPSIADNFRSPSTPSPFHPPPQIPALRIIKRSKTMTQQKPTVKDSPPQDALIPIGLRVPVSEAPVSSLAMITKKGHPSKVSQVQSMDKAHLPSSLASNGPRRVLISEGPKLNLAPNTKAGASANHSGPRRVAMVVPPTNLERASSSARPPIQPSSGLRQPVKYGSSVVKPVQHTVGSRLPAITRRSGITSGVDSGSKGTVLPARRVT